MESSGVKWVRLGDYIEQCDERNTKGMYSVEDVRGISIEKRIIDTKANMDGVSVTNYKLYRTNYFCYVPVTSRNGNKITLALNTYNATYIVSSAYEVFRVKDEVELLPLYLFCFSCVLNLIVMQDIIHGEVLVKSFHGKTCAIF